MQQPQSISRRTLLRVVAAATLSSGLGWPAAARAGACEAVLLSCMDYRLVDDVARYMTGRDMANNYDHLMLAGASLGALNAARMRWRETFWDHLDVAIDLHKIHKVFVMDHRDCGAFRTFLGEAAVENADDEVAAHRDHLQTLARAIHARHHHLEVELLLMDLDGRVSEIPKG